MVFIPEKVYKKSSCMCNWTFPEVVLGKIYYSVNSALEYGD